MPKSTIPQPQSSDNTVVDAIAHVGPTLEADALNSSSDSSTPEGQIAADLEPQAVDVQAITDDLTDDLQIKTFASVDQNLDDPLQSAVNGRVVTGPERLKTRLPGDTSSDPHTDLDNE